MEIDAIETRRPELKTLRIARQKCQAIKERYSSEWYQAMEEWEAAFKAVFTAGPSLNF